MNFAKLKTKKEKKIESDLLIRGTILPLVIGFALVWADITRTIFNIIGWGLLIFGCAGAFFYLRRVYLRHEETIKKTKEELLKMVKKHQ